MLSTDKIIFLLWPSNILPTQWPFSSLNSSPYPLTLRDPVWPLSLPITTTPPSLIATSPLDDSSPSRLLYLTPLLLEPSMPPGPTICCSYLLFSVLHPHDVCPPSLSNLNSVNHYNHATAFTLNSFVPLVLVHTHLADSNPGEF